MQVSKEGDVVERRRAVIAAIVGFAIASLFTRGGPALAQTPAMPYVEPPAAMYVTSTVHITVDDVQQSVNAAQVTPKFFETANVRPHLGRFFLDDDFHGDSPAPTAPERAVVISYDLWRRTFRSDARIIGRSLTIDGQPAVVVGIADREFAMPQATQLWLPKTSSAATGH
jgi:hypothetical protein